MPRWPAILGEFWQFQFGSRRPSGQLCMPAALKCSNADPRLHYKTGSILLSTHVEEQNVRAAAGMWRAYETNKYAKELWLDITDIQTGDTPGNAVDPAIEEEWERRWGVDREGHVKAEPHDED
ncbi:hypothetical protein AAE478_008551 [Parahypoxylon ruwenzoriense]